MNAAVTRVAASLAATGAAVAARKAVEFGWREWRHEEPPTLKDDEGDRQLRDLMLWLGIMTASVWLAKRLAQSTTTKVLGD